MGSSADMILKIDFSKLPTFNASKPAVWGNVCTDTLAEVAFLELVNEIPELDGISLELRKKIKMGLGLAFMRVNEKGDTHCPDLKSAITSIVMLNIKDILETPQDEKAYTKIWRMFLENDPKGSF